MSSPRSLLADAGFRLRAGAGSGSLASLETAFAVKLADDLLVLWSLSDGADGDGMSLLTVVEAEGYAGCFPNGFGYVPFTECNDSNPYVICSNEPLRGAVVHVFHDDENQLVCHGLARFLELVVAARQADADVSQIAGDFAFDRPDRTAADAETARELVRWADGVERGGPRRGEALRFAAQLFGPGQEGELAGVLALGDEYTREAVLARWAGLGTPAARERLREDRAAYRQFLADLRRAFDAAGVRTDSDRGDEFRLQPGNIGLNFAMLYAQCRRPGAMAEWVRRFQERLR